jgi:hypothetical protein
MKTTPPKQGASRKSQPSAIPALNANPRPTDDDSNGSSTKWLILPGLIQTFDRFIQIAGNYLNNDDNRNNRPLMILGGSGVGKSLFIEAAKQIYDRNNGNKGITIRVNCASFDSHLADSELFGHVKGSFTDAKEDKVGIVKKAENGLLILDEIGELPKPVQAKLLIFIEEGEFRRVGDNEILKSKLKIIGTTNKLQGDFREDFWYRFFPIFIPPLHERRLDILYFIASEYKHIFERLPCHYALSLLAHHWPGNFRELERVLYLIDNDNTSDRENIYDHGDRTTPFAGYLPFPTDRRETSLVDNDFVNLCELVNKSEFNLVEFNKIIGKYGLAIPFIFKTPGAYYNTMNKIIISSGRKPLSFASGKVNDEEDEGEKKLKNKSNKIDESKIPSMLLYLQHTLNNKSKFYMNLSQNIQLVSMEKSGFMNIWEFQKNEDLEKIGICFSAISKLFLRNEKTSNNVFNIKEIIPGESLWENPLEKKLFDKFNKKKIIRQVLSLILKEEFILDFNFTFERSWKDFIDIILQKLEENDFNKSMTLDMDNMHLFYDKNTTESLLKDYYKYLISKYKIIKRAAIHAEIKYGKFLRDAKSLGACDNDAK